MEWEGEESMSEKRGKKRKEVEWEKKGEGSVWVKGRVNSSFSLFQFAGASSQAVSGHS